MISHNPRGELDLCVFKNGLRTDLPHLFLTVSNSCVSGIDCFCIPLSSARAKSNYLRGCPPEDPRDRIRALQEIPLNLTHNTIHTSLRLHHYVCHNTMCIRMKYINMVYSSNMFMRISLIHSEFENLTAASTRTPMGIQYTLYTTVASCTKECDIIGTVDAHHLAQCTSILFCLNRVFQNCPCEKIIRPS